MKNTTEDLKNLRKAVVWTLYAKYNYKRLANFYIDCNTKLQLSRNETESILQNLEYAFYEQEADINMYKYYFQEPLTTDMFGNEQML